MLVTTRYSLPGPLTIEQGDAPGTFGVVNRDASLRIVLTVEALTGSVDDIELVANGDSVTFELEDVRRVTVRALDSSGTETYPASIAIIATNLPLSLNAAPSLSTSPSAPVYVQPVRSSTGTPLTVTLGSVGTWYTLMDANAAALGRTIYVPASAAAGLLVGLVADPTNVPTVLIAPGGYYEVPFGYVGEVRACWDAGGSAGDHIYTNTLTA